MKDSFDDHVEKLGQELQGHVDKVSEMQDGADNKELQPLEKVVDSTELQHHAALHVDHKLKRSEAPQRTLLFFDGQGSSS